MEQLEPDVQKLDSMVREYSTKVEWCYNNCCYSFFCVMCFKTYAKLKLSHDIDVCRKQLQKQEDKNA